MKRSLKWLLLFLPWIGLLGLGKLYFDLTMTHMEEVQRNDPVAFALIPEGNVRQFRQMAKISNKCVNTYEFEGLLKEGMDSKSALSKLDILPSGRPNVGSRLYFRFNKNNIPHELCMRNIAMKKNAPQQSLQGK